jgi:hypothetical protein
MISKERWKKWSQGKDGITRRKTHKQERKGGLGDRIKK